MITSIRKEKVMLKKCTNKQCETPYPKPREDFNRNILSPDGFDHQCRECHHRADHARRDKKQDRRGKLPYYVLAMMETKQDRYDRRPHRVEAAFSFGKGQTGKRRHDD